MKEIDFQNDLNAEVRNVPKEIIALQVKLDSIAIRRSGFYRQPSSLEQRIEGVKLDIEENEVRQLLANYIGIQKEEEENRRYRNMLLHKDDSYIPASHAQHAILNSERELEIIHRENSIVHNQFSIKGNHLQIELLDLLVEVGDISSHDRDQKVGVLEEENRRLMKDNGKELEQLDICRRKKISSQIEFNHTYGYATPDACEFQMKLLRNTPVLTGQSEQIILSSYPKKEVMIGIKRR